jgi:hypothetical protein
MLSNIATSVVILVLVGLVGVAIYALGSWLRGRRRR